MTSLAVVNNNSLPAADVVFWTLPSDEYVIINDSSSTTANYLGQDNTTAAYWSLPWRFGLSAILVAILVAAIVDNLLVIVVVTRNRGMRTKTNLFLCNLAVVDFLCAIIDMPFSLVTVASGGWIFNNHICKVY